MKNHQARKRACFGRRCVRCWIRYNGKIVRMLHVSDYRPCEAGGGPLLLVKLLPHRRYARGVQLSGSSWWGAQVLPGLIAGQWVQVDIAAGGAA